MAALVLFERGPVSWTSRRDEFDDGVGELARRVSAMATQRCRVSYSGRVQGVGFRATARSLARGFAVSGYVRNLPDGRVELLVEGEPEAVDSFLSALQRELGHYIHSSSSDREPMDAPEFAGFVIRY